MNAADRFRVCYVAGTGEFLVFDTTGRFCHGMPVVCADEAAVMAHAAGVVRDERGPSVRPLLRLVDSR